MPVSRHGVLYALAASLAVSASSALVKSCGLPAGQVTFLAGLGLALAGTPYAATTARVRPVFPSGSRLRVFLFALLSAFVLLADNQAVQLMPLADEVVISYSSIVFTVLLARLFLKERCGWSKLASTLLVMAGVGLITERGTTQASPYPKYALGFFLTLFASFFDGATFIFIKGLSGLHISAVLASVGWAIVFLTGPLELLENWSMPSQPLIVGSIVVLNLLQEVFLYLAVSAGEEAGIVSLVQASDIVFSFIWEVSFFRETQSWMRFLGAGLVSAGVSLGALTSERGEEPPVGYIALTEDKRSEDRPLVEQEEALGIVSCVPP